MIDVTCAIIRNEDDKVLVVQKGAATDHPLKWEFPGGKVLPGETDDDCIIREIREELSMEIVILSRLQVTEYDYGFRKIRLIPFICDTLDDVPLLTEHTGYRWIAPEDLVTVDLSEADIEVADNYLAQLGHEKILTPETASRPDNEVTDEHGLRAVLEAMMTRKQAEWLAGSAVSKPAVLRVLLDYSFSDDGDLAFRASWTLTKLCDSYPEVIYPYLNPIVEKLGKLKSESSLRSFLRIITLTGIEKISEKNQGILADLCFSLLRSGYSAVAIKAYSMDILYKLTLKYPELGNELSASINMIGTEGSAGIVARGRQILKKLGKGHSGNSKN